MNTNEQKIDEILTRGVAEILPSTLTLKKILQEKKIRLYLGIDPTGSLLTLGHSVVLRKLQQFADLGHEVILLIGNGTVRIGDPTGKDTTRPELTDEQIKENFKSWKEQASTVLDFNKIEIRYNGDWLDKLTMPDIVKLMAKTTVQQLMERDMFQKRLEEGKPIHGHEIIYPLLQGYDSVAMDVDLELGGTDQTFNMMMGRTLQKLYNDREKWVLTTPIINGTDGRKMSKSYGNFVALTENANDMYGKLMSTADEEIITYFEVLTDVPMNEIKEMSAQMKAGENPMQFKKKLAFTITQMYHDAQAAQQAEEHFQKTVQEKNINELEITGEASPEEKMSNIVDIIHKGPSNKSKTELRKLVESNAVTVFFKNGQIEKVSDAYKQYTVAEIDKVKFGKRNVFKVIPR